MHHSFEALKNGAGFPDGVLLCLPGGANNPSLLSGCKTHGPQKIAFPQIVFFDFFSLPSVNNPSSSSFFFVVGGNLGVMLVGVM